MMYALANDRLSSNQLDSGRVSAVGVRVLTHVEVGFVDNWAALSKAFGMGADTGRVHAILFLADTPMTITEAAGLADLSIERVDAVLAKLLEYGAAEAARTDDGLPGFVSIRDPWVWFSATVRQRARREFGPLLDSIRNVHALAEEAHRSGRMSEERFGRIVRFTRFVDQVAKLLETFGGAGSSKPMMSAARVMARFMCG